MKLMLTLPTNTNSGCWNATKKLQAITAFLEMFAVIMSNLLHKNYCLKLEAAHIKSLENGR
jgi:hypothetical protein